MFNKKIKHSNDLVFNTDTNQDYKYILTSIVLHLALFYSLFITNYQKKLTHLKKDNTIYFQVIEQNQSEEQLITKKTPLPKMNKTDLITKSIRKKSKVKATLNKVEKLSSSFTKKINTSNSGVIPNKAFKENVIFNKIPFYPTLAIRNGWQGKVLISILVDSLGRVISAKILKPSPFDVLNKSALKAAKKWKFKPDKNGNNFNVKKEVVFKIN